MPPKKPLQSQPPDSMMVLDCELWLQVILLSSSLSRDKIVVFDHGFKLVYDAQRHFYR